MSFKVGFGKHADRTLEWLFFNDPGYVWWMVENDAVGRLQGAARQRFDALVRRASGMKIPGHCAHCTRPVERMSVTKHPSGGLARVDFFCGECHHDGPRSLLVRPSFYTPDFFKSYDKLGGEFLVDAIKHRYYGSKVPRMTQKAMETFFSTRENFVTFP
jgi:hypothetical protein